MRSNNTTHAVHDNNRRKKYLNTRINKSDKQASVLALLHAMFDWKFVLQGIKATGPNQHITP
jgi:rhamnose utilization protein RhaD (predicted bifunctional aldolase and dehydrogenase)